MAAGDENQDAETRPRWAAEDDVVKVWRSPTGGDIQVPPSVYSALTLPYRGQHGPGKVIKFLKGVTDETPVLKYTPDFEASRAPSLNDVYTWMSLTLDPAVTAEGCHMG